MDVFELSYDDARSVFGSIHLVGELSNKVIGGAQYFTAEEIVSMFEEHMGADKWAARKARGVINFDE